MLSRTNDIIGGATTSAKQAADKAILEPSRTQGKFVDAFDYERAVPASSEKSPLLEPRTGGSTRAPSSKKPTPSSRDVLKGILGRLPSTMRAVQIMTPYLHSHPHLAESIHRAASSRLGSKPTQEVQVLSAFCDAIGDCLTREAIGAKFDKKMSEDGIAFFTGSYEMLRTASPLLFSRAIEHMCRAELGQSVESALFNMKRLPRDICSSLEYKMALKGFEASFQDAPSQTSRVLGLLLADDLSQPTRERISLSILPAVGKTLQSGKEYSESYMAAKEILQMIANHSSNIPMGIALDNLVERVEAVNLADTVTPPPLRKRGPHDSGAMTG